MPIRLIHATLVGTTALYEDETLTIGDDGLIVADDPTACEWNCHGGLLLPGAIDIHCDAIEKCVEARPGVPFPLEFSLPQIDIINAAAGITTVYHALSFERAGQGSKTIRSDRTSCAIIAGLEVLRRDSLVDHRRLLRYEVTFPETLSTILDLITQGQADLVSINDHSPGQGQFKDLEAFIHYYTANRGFDAADADAFGRQLQEASRQSIDDVRRLIAHCHAHHLQIASHDDDSAHQVESFHKVGVRLCEFPVCLEAAHRAHELDMPSILGAPNVIRGGSQSGNLRALDAIKAGVCDCLCSDYAPWTLIQAALLLPDLCGLGLPQAVALISANPAQAAGLTDRGRIEIGRRADLVLVDTNHRPPRISRVWSAGRPIFQAENRCRTSHLQQS